MAFFLNLIAGLLAGLGVVYLLRNRLDTAALVGPVVAGVACFVLMCVWFTVEATAITQARGEPPCGAFGAMVVIGTLGGALVDFVAVLGVVVVVAIFRWMRNRYRLADQAA